MLLDPLYYARYSPVVSYQWDLGPDHAANYLHTDYGRLGLPKDAIGQYPYSPWPNDRLEPLLFYLRLLLVHPGVVVLED